MTARGSAGGWILAAAVLLASPLPGLSSVAAAPHGPPPANPATSNGAAATPVSSPSSAAASPLASPLSGNLTLASLAQWAGLPALDGNARVKSPLLGLSLSAADLAKAYEAKAEGSPTPLLDAVAAWNTALALQPAAALAADPRLQDANALPLGAQRAAATMLYALTDATLLQRQAVSHLSVAQYRALLAAPAQAAAGRFDPGVPDARAALDALRPAAAAVDAGSIQAATQIVTAAAQQALPALRAWSQAGPAPPSPQQGMVQDLLARDSPARVAALDSADRIAVAEDALRLAAHAAGLPDAASPAPIPLDAAHPLASAIASLLSVTHTPWQDASANLLAADRLPRPLQQALGQVVAASANLEQVAALAGHVEPRQAAADALSAQLGVLEGMRAAAPTIEAWGLVWGHMGQGLLPATPVQANQALRYASDLGRLDTDGRLRALIEMARPGIPLGDPAWSVPAGTLDDGVLHLYARYGLPVDAATAQKVRAGVAALPPDVAAGAAGILWAELGALGRLDRLYATLTPADGATLAAGVDLRPLLDGTLTAAQLQKMRATYALADQVESAYLDGSAGIAAAVLAASHSLAHYSDGTASSAVPAAPAAPAAPGPAAPKPSGWWGQVQHFFGGLHLLGVAAAQAPTVPPQPDVPPQNCPTSALSDCAHDIWFEDPIYATIVIGGTGSTTYSPDILKPTQPPPSGAPRGQMLTLDLGGDDVYENNAGGARYVLPPDPTTAKNNLLEPVSLDSVAVAVQLGGNPRYLTPAGNDHDGIQGAGLGGIGLLYDRKGDAHFTADQRAQGYASGAPACPAMTAPSAIPVTAPTPCGGVFGVGILVHGDGAATYAAQNRAQGAAEEDDALPCPALPAPCPTPVLPGGLGILLEGNGPTTYAMPDVQAPHLGQGGATAGLAFLVDGGGDDHYLNGMQGQATEAGVGMLVDLGGSDTYTRQFRGDGQCWTSLRAPGGSAFDLLNAGQRDSFVNNVTGGPQTGLGLFLDVTPGAPQCTSLVGQLVTPPDPVQLTPGSDGWPAFVDHADPFGAGGWDPGNQTDYPAGLPQDDPLCAQGPPPAAVAGLCKPGNGLPYGSSYLVRIPGVLAVGDAVATVYPAASPGQSGRDYAVTLDLGGGDLFLNRMGGGPGIPPLSIPSTPLGGIPPPSIPFVGSSGLAPLLPSVGLDVGNANVYSSDGACVQGCNSLLADLGTGPVFEATRPSPASDPTVAQGACAVQALPLAVGLLFHAQGTATYTIGSMQGIGQGAAVTRSDPTTVTTDTTSATTDPTASVLANVPAGGPCLGVLVDTGGGADTYHSPTQGVATGNGVGVGLFLHLGGQDTYSPVGSQGVGSAETQGGNLGLFVHQGAANDPHPDRFVGTVANPAAPDLSAFYDNRTFARLDASGAGGLTSSTVFPPSVGFFWDQAGPSATASNPMSPGAGGGLDLPGEGIRVGGAGDDVYNHDYALLIDQGGNNQYNNNAGATLLRGPITAASGSTPAPVVGTVPDTVAALANPWDNYPVAAALIDLGGSDTFDALGRAAVRASDAAGASLVEPAGGILAQGAGLLGVGLLVRDGSAMGTDHYQARGFAQGAAMLGAGILWKRSGTATFAADPDTVQAPAIDAGVVAWREFTGGQWRLMARSGAGPACLVSPAGDLGPVGDFALEGPRDGKPNATFVYSEFGANLLPPTTGGLWTLHKVDITIPTSPSGPSGACSVTTQYIAGAVRVSPTDSNQVHPALLPDRIVWQDDRSGVPTLYAAARSASQPEHTLCTDATPPCPAGAQTEPDAADGTVSWTQAEGGGSAVYTLDASSQLTRVSAPGSALRQDAHPRIAGVPGQGLIVWQSRARTAPDAAWGDWGVVVADRATLSPKAIALPGDQVAPDTDGERVIFHDVASGQTLCSGCLPGQTTLLRDAADQAVLDRTSPLQAAWRVDGLPATATMPAGSPSAEVERGSLFLNNRVPVSTLATHPSGSFLQGAAFLGGLGLLLDEGGNDRFTAGDHAQGAAFSLDLSGAQGTAPQSRSLGTQGAHGVLAVVAGNDRFTAAGFSQGAILDVPTNLVIPSLPRVPSSEQLAASEGLGLLLTLHGSDTYLANAASQGFGALMAGADTVGATSLMADGAAGILMDLGGTDFYTPSIWVNPTRVAVGDPCGLLGATLQTFAAQCRSALAPTAPPGDVDTVWVQGANRNGAMPCASASPTVDANLTSLVLCADPVALPHGVPVGLGTLLVVGGVGMDLSLLDRSDLAVATAAANDMTVNVLFQEDNAAHTPIGNQDRAAGRIRLVAAIGPGKIPVQTLNVQSVEFYLDGRSLGFGTPDPNDTTEYVLPLDTATDLTPDGTHQVVVHALVGAAPQTPSVGYVQGSGTLAIDNPPRILQPTLSASSFSPAPASGAPTFPRLDFNLTKGSPSFQNPSDPDGYVLVQVRDAAGKLVRTLASPTDGPAPNPFNVAWNGTAADNSTIVAPGLYTIVAQASDRLVNGHLDPTRLATSPSFPVEVDSTPPTEGCIRVVLSDTALSGCNPVLQVNKALADRLSPPALALTLTADPAHPLRAAHLFRSDDLGATWTEVPQGAGALHVTYPVPEHGGFRLLALAEDRDGNIECIPGCGQRVGPAGTLDAAVRTKAALGNFTTFAVDLDPPQILGITGAQPLTLDGVPHPFTGDDPATAPRVGPNTAVGLSFIIQKQPVPGLDPPHALITVISDSPAADRTNLCFQRTFSVPGAALDPQHPDWFNVTWPAGPQAASVWHDVVQDPACPWPDGPLLLSVAAVDEVGNLAEDNPSTFLALVGTAPQVDLAASHIEYPAGRLYALHGDTITLVVKTMPHPPGLGFDDSRLCVQMGANELVPDPARSPCGPNGLSCTPPPGDAIFCHDPLPSRQAFVVTVPITEPTDHVKAHVVSITYTITDPVGNFATSHLDVVVGAPDLGIGESQAVVGVGMADVLFRTAQPSTARLYYGQTEKALNQSRGEVPDPAGLVHAFHLPHLVPGATYYYQVLATNATGAQQVSPATLPLPHFRVLFGLGVTIGTPTLGAILAGVVPVHLDATIQLPQAAGDKPFVTVTLVPHNASLAPVDLFDGAPGPDGVNVPIATASPASPDGLYDLVAQATYNGEVAQSRVANLLLDNTPPTGAFLFPAPDAVLPVFPHTLLLRASDAGSGVADAVTLFVNGTPVPAQAKFVPDAQGSGGVLKVAIPLGLNLKGPVRLLITVSDKAGCQTQVASRFIVDPDAPQVLQAAILYPDDQLAARPGQAVRLLATFGDPAGIASATADLRAVDGSATAQMQQGPLGYWLDFVVPAQATSGALAIPFQATNPAGLTATGQAILLVDNDPPRLLSATGIPTALDAATLNLTASEPVRAFADVLEGGARILRTAPSDLSDAPALALTGLQPSHDYVLRIHLTDRAGNVATADVAWRFAPVVVAPGPITRLVARPATSGIRLTWDVQTPSDAFRYDVLRSDGGLFHHVATVAAATFLDAGVTPGNQYQYFVQASNLRGDLGPASPVATSVAGLGAALAPSVSPSLGLAGQTQFVFRLDVHRALETRPLAWLVVDGTRYAMDPPAADCRDACAFTRSMPLPALDLKHPEVRYSVELLDGGRLLELPDGGTLPGPEVLAPAIAPHGVAFLGAPAAGALLLPLLLAAALARRRRLP